MHSLPSLVVILGILVTLATIGRRNKSRKPKLPPGPTSYPLIGHLLSLPTKFDHLEYMKLGGELGSKIISLSALGTTIVVFNDRADAVNLLDKRSAKYSDRTPSIMVSDPSLFDWATIGILVRYGDRFRKYRRLTELVINKNSLAALQESQEHRSQLLLQQLLKRKDIDSKYLQSELYLAVASTLLRSIYGYEVKSSDDPYLIRTGQAIDRLGKSILPTDFMVNIIPALRYLPTWFPGAGWKRTAQTWRNEKELLLQDLFQLATDEAAKGTRHIMLAAMKEQAPLIGLSKEETNDYVQQVAITLMGGGTDTIVGSLLMFFLAMTLFPDVQKKAQAELDEVLEGSRLPTLKDRLQLGYVGRVVQEVLRWGPAAPLALPHTCFEDDEYKGYHIPKGAIVLGNVWAMTRDQEVYEDPENFEPDRFLDPEVPPSPVFGWGRRRCPGARIAEDTLFVFIASVLSTFNIHGATQAKSKSPKLLSTVFLELIPAVALSRPDIFQLSLLPRSEKHKNLVPGEL